MSSSNRIVLLFITLFYCVTDTTNAQKWIPNFKHYGIPDGLPSSEVYQITSDTQKNLWFVTDRGIVKYDGTIFRVFDKKDSLPENSVIKVYTDFKGRIWFISYTGLLSYYENGKIIPYRFNSLIRQNTGARIFVSLQVDNHETVILNGIEGNVFKIDSLGNFSKITPIPSISTFVITDNRSFSPSTFCYHLDEKEITRIKVQRQQETFEFLINEKISYSHFGTTRLSNNDLIFYCGQTLIRIRDNKNFIVKHFESPVLNVCEDYEKRIWIGRYQDGVSTYDSSFNNISNYLTGISVSHILTDYENGLWLSTLENGIFYLPSKSHFIFAPNENIRDEKINATAASSEGDLFFATTKGILYKFNEHKGILDKIDLKKETGLSFATVNSLFSSSRNKTLAIAMEANFNQMETKPSVLTWNGIKTIPVYSSTRFIEMDADHVLCSGYEFVYSLNTSSYEKNHITREKFHVTTLYKDSKNRLLAGGLNGLFIYQDSSFIPFDSTNGILRKRITGLAELDTKYLVIATRSDGIIIYSNSQVKAITDHTGLSSNNINHIISEGNTVWASTNRGLNKITITNYNPFEFVISQYNVSSGLPSDEINDFAITGKNIYVATNEGLALIKDDMPVGMIPQVPIYINSVKINDKDTSLLKSYLLDFDQNTFNITFAAVSFRHSKNISYIYRMQGLDSTWRKTTNRDVQFTNLPPGNYRFQLLAQNNETTFSATPVEIGFDISPPFYQSSWFRLFVAFVFWLGIFILIRLRVNVVKRKAEERNELNRKFSELNLNALRSQMNPHFTFNVLNSIQYYIAKQDAESAQIYITKFSRLIRMILDQSRTEFISLTEEIRILKLYIELEELRFEKKFSHSINVGTGLETSSIYIPGMLIQPFVENSIKHGIRFKKGEANVVIEFRTADSVLICTITDNGIGREEAARLKPENGEFKSIGTEIVKDRIEALSILFKGKLKNYTHDLLDEQGNPAGTRVTIEVPFKTFRK